MDIQRGFDGGERGRTEYCLYGGERNQEGSSALWRAAIIVSARGVTDSDGNHVNPAVVLLPFLVLLRIFWEERITTCYCT